MIERIESTLERVVEKVGKNRDDIVRLQGAAELIEERAKREAVTAVLNSNEAVLNEVMNLRHRLRGETRIVLEGPDGEA